MMTEFVDIKRRHINEYLKEGNGCEVQCEDFRTWAEHSSARASWQVLEPSLLQSPHHGREISLLASIRDSDNLFLSSGAIFESNVAGITTPGILENRRPSAGLVIFL
jgi:hypothetical protein